MKSCFTKFDPKVYTLSAAIIGFALIDNFNASEQNALANWFILIGQVLETNSGFSQLKQNTNNNLYTIEKTIDIMKKEINDLKNKI